MLNELVIENLIEQMDTLSLINFYQSSEKPMKQIIKTLMGYKSIAENVLNKAFRECLIEVLMITRLDMFDDLDEYYHLDKYGYRRNFLNEERKKEVELMMMQISDSDRLQILQEYSDKNLITLHSLIYDPELTSKIRKESRNRERNVLQRFEQHKELVIKNFLNQLKFPQLLDLSVAIGNFLEQSPKHLPIIYSDYQNCLQRKVRYLLTNFGLIINPENATIIH